MRKRWIQLAQLGELGLGFPGRALAFHQAAGCQSTQRHGRLRAKTIFVGVEWWMILADPMDYPSNVS